MIISWEQDTDRNAYEDLSKLRDSYIKLLNDFVKERRIGLVNGVEFTSDNNNNMAMILSNLKNHKSNMLFLIAELSAFVNELSDRFINELNHEVYNTVSVEIKILVHQEFRYYSNGLEYSIQNE